MHVDAINLVGKTVGIRLVVTTVFAARCTVPITSLAHLIFANGKAMIAEAIAIGEDCQAR